jgi:hypothetical protein
VTVSVNPAIYAESALEEGEQKALFEWAALSEGRFPELRWMFHVPNGGLRPKVTAKRLTAQGVKAGVPDICLPVARGGFHGLWIEMKRRVGGNASTKQMTWIGYLNQAGYKAVICEGWQEAAAIITAYLESESGTAPRSIRLRRETK